MITLSRAAVVPTTEVARSSTYMTDRVLQLLHRIAPWCHSQVEWLHNIKYENRNKSRVLFWIWTHQKWVHWLCFCVWPFSCNCYVLPCLIGEPSTFEGGCFYMWTYHSFLIGVFPLHFLPIWTCCDSHIYVHISFCQGWMLYQYMPSRIHSWEEPVDGVALQGLSASSKIFCHVLFWELRNYI